LEHDASQGESGAYGEKFEVRGNIVGPTGQEAILVAVWIVLCDEDFPRLVTAYPGSKA
jgi:hypothetical protein